MNEFERALNIMEGSDLQQRYLMIASKHEEAVVDPGQVGGEFWVLTDGSVIETPRHRNAMDWLKVGWDEWLGTGAVRGLVGADMVLEKLAGVKLSKEQVDAITAMVRKKGIYSVAIETTQDDSTKQVRFEEIKYESSDRVFVQKVRRALMNA